MRLFRTLAAAALGLLASGCLLTPGKFDAGLTVRKDGTFTYRYTGEIVLLTGHTMMAMASAADDKFQPEDQVCWDEAADDAEPETRDCTDQEIEAERKKWEEGKDERAEEKKREAAMMKAMLGGIDPTDPKTMDEFAQRLQGYEGWKSVTHKGNGLFDIQYEVTGRLDHDFVYPVFPGVDYLIPFVQVTRRTGDKVRIAAPAFIEGNEGSLSAATVSSAMQGMGEMMKPGTLKKPEGTFTVTTDAEILTNNTNDGPAKAGTMRVLKWVVGPLDSKKPEALLQL
ncbi:MAG TPA: hypothetical protein VGD10_00260 [Allosphingosinicella sp.]|uniref:hypothetical protein n=1 Tax=Allosphingosinicella sp. TaxID=2823234 RepID=UPI002ED7E3DE